MIGRLARSPTSRQSSSRLRLGCQSNQWSHDQAPTTRTRSRGIHCSFIASSACISFHTSTSSGSSWTSPLFVRLSQLMTGYAVWIPSRFAART
jgi:hypothetical protein